MADPHIEETLDIWDKVSISVYRSGIIISGLAFIALALQQLFYPLWFKQIVVIIALGAILQASSLHIYMKSFRTILVSTTWIGLWLLSLSFTLSGPWVAYFALGGFFVTQGGLAFKESFCFSLQILKAIPIFVAAIWFLIVFQQAEVAAVGLILVAGLYLYMGWKKVNMPLHFDLGDRSKYEI
ncbi:MAG TPA: hypothetical protein EYH12_02495 [Psychromonas hadalis]|nr:hypothetical protein [Psychromonas hadalis]